MPTVCFNTKWFLLFMFTGFSIIGLSLWIAYKNSVIENLRGSKYTPEPDPFPITPTPPTRQLLRAQDIMYRSGDIHGFPPPPVFPRPPAPGYGDNYDGRIGFVFNENKEHGAFEKYRLPLYGQRDYPGSRNYRYFVLDHTQHQNKIELDFKDYLGNDDKVKVPGYDGEFTVQLYDRDLPRF